jgi:hypothetical protein
VSARFSCHRSEADAIFKNGQGILFYYFPTRERTRGKKGGARKERNRQTGLQFRFYPPHCPTLAHNIFKSGEEKGEVSFFLLLI